MLGRDFFRNATKSLRSRFVYLIGDEGAILVYIEDGVVQRRLFAPTADRQHTRAFIELMNEYPKAPILALIDVMDQSYIRHSFPPVTSFGLNRIVERRLDRDFAKDDIKGALPLGREESGRKDWNFLLISLAYTKELQGWLDIVLDLPNRFAGLFLVPVESEFLIDALDKAIKRPSSVREPALMQAAAAEIKAEEREEPGKKSKLKKPARLKKEKLPKEKTLKTKAKKKGAAVEVARWQILVSHDKVGGYRQVVLRAGKLVFTRLTQASEGSAELQAGNVEQEIQNTIEYLKRLGYNDQAPLDIYVLLAQEVKSCISPRRFGQSKLHLMTPHEAGEALGLKQAVLSGDKYGDMILAATFGTMKKRRLRLFPAYAVKLGRVYQMRTALRIATLLVLLGLIGYLSYDLVQVPLLLSKDSDLATQQRAKQNDLARLQSTSNNLHADADEVSDLVAIHGLLATPGNNPLDIVRNLQPLFDATHLLKNFDWKMADPAAPGFHLKNAVVAAPSTTPGAASAPNPLAFTTALGIELMYQGNSWDDFTKGSTQYLQSFQKAFAGFGVTHTDLPGQTGDEQSITINYEEEAARQKAAASGQSFDVTVILSGPAKIDPALPGKGSPATPPPAGKGAP